MTDRSGARRPGFAFVAVALVALTGSAAAQTMDTAPAGTQPPPAEDAVSSPYRLSVHWDNDGAFATIGNETDRWYTNGLSIEVAHQPRWADGLAEWLGWASDRTAAGYHLGHEIYTPVELTAFVPDPNDRPYAGYLFGGAFWQRERSAHLDHFQLDLGVVGPGAQAEHIQTWVHETFEGDDPNGWAFEIENQPAVQAYWRRKWRFGMDLDRAPYTKRAEPSEAVQARGFDTSGLGVEVIPQVGLAVGNVHRYAEAGGVVRLGWRLPDDYGPGFHGEPAAATGLRAMEGRGRGFHVYGYGKAVGRAVEHNVFIEGNPRIDYGLDIDLTPLVGEAGVGVVAGYRGDRWQADLQYGVFWITDEFDQQGDVQRITSVSLVLTGWF